MEYGSRQDSLLLALAQSDLSKYMGQSLTCP